MHPSRAIRGRRSRLLEGRRIVLGVSGSIAAVEAPRIARELIRHGAEVRAVMTGEATRIVTEEAMHFATGHRPVTQLSGEVEHVASLGPGEGQADLLLIAPATANTLSKIAHGIDDTALTSFASVALGAGVPILLAPAMHEKMGENPAVRENLERLRGWGVGLIPPNRSEGEEKLASPEEVAAAVLHRLGAGPWSGRRVIVVGGASREGIDEVRSITNHSSGSMAVALATAAFFRGAEVELWAGSLEVPVPAFLPLERWGSVGSLLELVRRRSRELHRADAVLLPAALSDFTLDARRGKLPSDRSPAPLRLRPAPKVLPALRKAAPPPALLLAFKLLAHASEGELGAAAGRLREGSGADWVAANESLSLGASSTRLLLVGPNGRRHWLSGPKVEVAGRLLDEIAVALPPRPPGGRRRGRSDEKAPRVGRRGPAPA